jgi:hypothetical protein
MKKVLIMLGVLAVLALGGTSASAASTPAHTIKPYLTYNGALSRAAYLASEDWGRPAEGEYCTGPYENVRHHTQWACYGYFTDGGTGSWQVNVDPYGEQTYHHYF